MKLSIEIRDNGTGVVRSLELERKHYKTKFPLYFWRDGSFGCDCNRRDLFREAGGEQPIVASPCGRGGFGIRITSESRVLLDELGGPNRTR